VARHDRARCAILARVHIVVDNSAGGDAQLAADVAQGLRERDLDVELREPKPATMFDTSVHLVTAGIVVRVEQQPDRALLQAIEEVVRAALMHRPSMRRRTRTVPVHLGESSRVLEWIDVFD
jgi:hypothetical protein